MRLPYNAIEENRDNWRYIGMETGFAAVSLILPAVILNRTIKSLNQSVANMIAANGAKVRFLANMSHELRTPLNAIIGFSELTKEQYFGPLNERYREYATDIHRSGLHLLTIINDILDLSKLEAHQLNFNLKEIALPDKMASISRMVETLCKDANVDLHLDIAGSLPSVRADPLRLKQVLLNLLSNAIKFTPSGGHITVAVVPVSGFVEVSVTDTGIGIAAEDLEKVMKPFFQVESDLNRTHDGTGLGLPITVRLIEGMGGRFSLESELGIGTRAVIYLPSVIENLEAAA